LSEVLHTTVYARLPESLRLLNRPSAWAARQPRVGAIHSLLEGPCPTLDGRFFCVDVAHGRILELVDREFRVAVEYDGQPNGLRAHRDGRIFVADHKNGIMVFDPDDHSITPVLSAFEGEPFLGLNDLIFADNGDLYFTDQGLSGLHDPSGSVFRWSVEGSLHRLLGRIPSPNGLVFNDDQTELYLGVTRDNAIWRLPITEQGSTSKVGRFIQLSGGIGPDGLALDSKGNILVAHVGLGCVWLFSPRGETLSRIASCEGFGTTNIAFGGEDLKTLFITEAESGTVLTAAMPVPGRVPFSHK
jgi:gluconolactonase